MPSDLPTAEQWSGPPSPEELEAWAAEEAALANNDKHRMFGLGCTDEAWVRANQRKELCERRAAFLRSERLASALALLDAVEWIEKNSPEAHYRPYPKRPWQVFGYGPIGSSDGATLTEAVNTLRARLADGEGKNG